MKKRLQLLSLVLILSFAVITQLSVKPASAVLLNRDLVISGGEYLEIVSEQWDINGDIIVEKGGTLALMDAAINIISPEKGRTVTFIDATFIVQNATIASTSWFSIYFTGTSNVTASELNVEFGILYFQDSTSARLTRFNYATESPYPRGAVRVQDSSIVTMSNSTMMEAPPRSKSLLTDDSVSLSLYDSQVWELDAQGSSQVSLMRTGVFWALGTSDSSKVTVVRSFSDWVSKNIPLAISGIATAELSALTVNDTIMKSAKAYDFSSISIYNTTLQDAKVNAYNSSIVTLTKSIMKGISVDPTIIAYESAQVTIIDSVIQGISTVAAYDATEVTLQNSKLRELGVFDESQATVSDSQLSGLSFVSGSASASFSDSELAMVQTSDSSSISVSNSGIEELKSYAASQIVISDSNVTLLRSSDSSSVTATDCAVKEVFIYFRSINADFSNLNPGILESWDSLDVAEMGAGGYAPRVTLARTTVQLGWGFWFFGASNVTITDSTLESIGVSGTSTVGLMNSTLISDPSVMSGGNLYVSWYLNVYSVAGASVSVYYANGTLAQTTTAGADGVARFTLVERTVDSLGTNDVGNYKVVTTSNGVSSEMIADLTSSQKLMFSSPVPWWQEFWYVIALVAVAVVIVAAIFLMRRKGGKSSS